MSDVDRAAAEEVNCTIGQNIDIGRRFVYLENIFRLELLNSVVEMFLNMKNLRVLDLRINKFPQLDRDTLDRFKNLEKLEL